MTDVTFNEHGSAMLERARELREQHGMTSPSAGRDFSLAITHLEDALMRFNSAMYHLAGTWTRADPERLMGQ